MPYTPKDATPATAAANREAVARYDLADRQDFADADRGLIAGFPDRRLPHADGHRPAPPGAEQRHRQPDDRGGR
jgi:alkyl sulfatase BDS1-like metallo-beta-lactamase superfamily hydrolase